MRRLITWMSIIVCSGSTAVAQHALTIEQSQFVRDGELADPDVRPDAFGQERPGIWMRGTSGRRDQLRWTCAALPAGDYWLGLEVIPGPPSHYLANEFASRSLTLYLNDTPLVWGGYTEPRHPRDGANTSRYMCELRTRTAVALTPADTVRLVHTRSSGGSWSVIGNLVLHGVRPEDNAVVVSEVPVTPAVTPATDPFWVTLTCAQATEEAGRIRQPLTLFNPGVRERVVHLNAVARGYTQGMLLERDEAITAPALGEKQITLEFPASTTQRDALFLTLTGDTPHCPAIRKSRFWVRDVTAGPRRRFGLNGEWELAFLPGPDTGDTPPADVQWETTQVPAELSNAKGHCAWLRKTFVVPEFLAGERYVLFFDHTLCEARIVLNGRQVALRAYGSEPFEVDVTDALRRTGENTLLVAVRDWIAYSPTNQERLRAGEKVIFKDHMKSPAGYTLRSALGIRGPVWLETRPQVRVEDVSVVTRVAEKRLELTVRLRNDTDTPVEAQVAPTVLERAQVLFGIKPQRVSIPARGVAAARFARRWRRPTLWWPGQPYLYVLQTTVTAAGVPDRHVQRFGFRDIRIEDTSFLVNGVRMKLRSQWTRGATGVSRRRDWDPAKRLESIWDWQRDCVEHYATQVSRTHNHVGVREICEMADESGLMLKIENGHVCQQKFSFSKAWWEAAMASECAMVSAYKNHASVFFWSAGNENMWGWAYQGEAVRTLANRWQVRVAEAMTAADPMQRPVEWEADGDLMGKWNYHALHYPRELNRHSDLPDGAWWGPLDGKTVVAYTMGDITLGEKPLTVGEAYWPANMNRPWGMSILTGDSAFGGGCFWRQGWQEACRFLTNGLRDAQFALIDIYDSLADRIPPGAIVLKEEETRFFSGRTLERHVNLHSDVPRRRKLTFRWRLDVAGRESGRGEDTLRFEPAELKRVTIDLQLPAVDQPEDAVFTTELVHGKQIAARQARCWRLTPPAQLHAPPGLKLHLFDPDGETAGLLESLGVPSVRTPQLSAPAEGVLVIAPNALAQAPEGNWRSAIAAFVHGGGRVLVLTQDQTPDFLPVRLTQSKRPRTTIAFVRAVDHPVLQGLTDEDLRWWADGHAVAARNYRKPTRGNWLPLVDAGTIDGPVETCLLEEYDGGGSIVLCQMPVISKARTAPPALRLLQNLLDYLAAPAPYRVPGTTVVFAAADSPLCRVLDDARLVYTPGAPETPLDPETVAVALADASQLTAATAARLSDYARSGGTVFLHRPEPDSGGPLLAAMTGSTFRFLPVEKEPREVQFMCLRRGNAGMMAGISNHELYWSYGRHKTDLQHEGGWWSAYKVEPDDRIADWYLEPTLGQADAGCRLTRPGAVVEVPLGRGRVVVSTLRLDRAPDALAVTVTRLSSLLLTNLGCTLRGDGGADRARKERLRRYEFFTVALAPYANRGWRDDAEAGIIGWTHQGENDMRNLPTGNQRLAEVPFHFATPKGAITLYSLSANNTDCPKEVNGISVGRRADVLFFLHAMAWGAPAPFRYRINYEDGTQVMFEVKGEQHVLDWWAEPTRYAEAMERYGLFIAWQGDNPMHKGVVLPGCEWTNPHPGKVIDSIDFLTVADSGYRVVPVLAAVTGAVSRPHSGTVEDIIGTRGIKVRLGTQVAEVYYIGVAGVPDDHPFRQQALAAHREMVVGNTVSLLDDDVTRNARGERLAYVYLGRSTYSARDLVNARIIGAGLGKLGNFEGNSKQRMYLENLGFIARQKQQGMWGDGKP